MRKLTFVRIFTLTTYLFLATTIHGNTNYSFPWSYTITAADHSIMIPAGTITIDGQAVEPGDVVGVFYEHNGVLQCGGYSIILSNDSNTVVAAWGDEIINPVKNGFDVGEVFKWKIRRNSTGVIYEAEALFSGSFIDSNSYVIDGLSGLISLNTVAPNTTWDYINTGNNHVVFLPVSNILIDGQNLNPGDIIGVFYTNGQDIECGGYRTLTNPVQNTHIAAWGDDLSTSVKDGFSEGEALRWKIFRHSENKVFEAMPVYDVTFPNRGDYLVNGVSGLASLVTTANSLQTILLTEGWSMISTFIDPGDNDIEILFQSVINKLILFKDGGGAVFWPTYGVNMIDSLTIGKGYQVKMQTTDSVYISGSLIVPDNMVITIPASWSILGYLRQLPSPITEVLSALTNQIDICKNDNGKVYWPQYNVNNLGLMFPSEGYLIKMSSTANFTFPANQNILCSPQPSIANAGPDQLNIAQASVLLAASYPVSGTGVWSIFAGNGGTFSDTTSNSSIFYGGAGESYTLVWTVSNLCGSNSDTMILSFYNPSLFECGFLWNDPRDGHWYTTVGIGNQCWMAENLNYGGFITNMVNSSNNSLPEKYCYNNLPVNCELRGGMYRWDELMDYSTSEGVQGLCPTGWHVPTDAEWFTLENFVDSTINDPSQIGFRGTDAASKLVLGGTSGLDLLFAGVYTGNSNYFGLNPGQPKFTYYATSTEYAQNANQTWLRYLHENEPGVKREPDSKYYSTAVRCLADNTILCAPMPSQANAGPDRFTINADSILLNASTPSLGTGQWSLVQGSGAVIAELTNPASGFTGILGESYLLAWTVSNACGTSSDTVNVYFLNDSNLLCGGVLPDLRDSTLYHTVQLGNRCWMVENLNYGSMINAGTEASNDSIAEKYCYNNDIQNCNTQGGLYRWDELMEYTAIESSQGLCPQGWHVPSDAEWSTLENYLDTSVNNPNQEGMRGIDAGTIMKAGGTSGLDILLSGIYAGSNNFYGQNPSADNFGVYATSSEHSQLSYNTWSRKFTEYGTGVIREHGSKLYSTAVRCVKDN